MLETVLSHLKFLDEKSAGQNHRIYKKIADLPVWLVIGRYDNGRTNLSVDRLVYQYLLLTEFEGRIVSYGPSFFLLDLWPKREARGP